MIFTIAIDISTFIWDTNDYNSNQEEYFRIIGVTPSLYHHIVVNKKSVLMRGELSDLIFAHFPYAITNQINYDYTRLSLLFLTTVEHFPYSSNIASGLISNPPLLKPYFNQDLTDEAIIHISHLFQDSNIRDYKFISAGYFYSSENRLTLSDGNRCVEIDTLFYNSEVDIISFFELHKLKFDHNPKHTARARIVNGEKVSPFTCFHGNNGATRAQQLLETAIPYQNDYYNYDDENEVYVKFVQTNGRIFHGYDLSDEGHIVPMVVKNKFNKNGRTF